MQLCVDVWGDLACFTRPETNVERWTYPCPTPSAARGILDSIFWDGPQFRWEVRRVEILRPVRTIPLRRNEVKGVVPAAEALRWMDGAPARPLQADSDDPLTGRTQRMTIALADVRYRISAELRVRDGTPRPAGSFAARFGRRVDSGKCFQQPYLGCREFVAYFGRPDPAFRPVAVDFDLGYMTYDLFDLDRWDGVLRPSVFLSTVRGGVMDVPPYGDPRVLKAR